MKTKLYLDTSIPSAFFDHSKPLRQLITQQWFAFDSSSYELYISVIAVEEIERMANVQKRQLIKDLLLTHKMKILELTGNAVKF
jgi:predicted nucleic acid-binding protein